MSIYVQVRIEARDLLDSFAGFPYQDLVSLEHAEQFPMLAYTDPYGLTIFNRWQVRVLDRELVNILDMVARDGVLPTAHYLGADKTAESTWIPGWDLDRDFVPLVHRLREACAVVGEKYHRYLCFSGD